MSDRRRHQRRGFDRGEKGGIVRAAERICEMEDRIDTIMRDVERLVGGISELESRIATALTIVEEMKAVGVHVSRVRGYADRLREVLGDESNKR